MATGLPDIARPTGIRYVVLTLTTMVAVLLYVDRVCLSYAEIYVREDLGVSEATMSWTFTAFFVAYALGQLPAGWLSDRFGARLILSLFLAIWSTFTGLMGLAQSVLILISLRLGCGLFEASGYPAAAGIIRHWLPFRRRGLASGIVSVGGRFGGALTPLLTAMLILAFVPVGVSSLVEPPDIMDASSFFPKQNPNADEVKLKAQSALSRQILEQLHGPAKGKEITVPMAKSVWEAFVSPFSEPGAIAQLTAAINRCLDMPKLFDGIDLTLFELPMEATRLLKSAATTLSPAKLQRRNRLVFEVVFPEALRKVYGKGWRPVIMIYGVFGIVVAGLFWLFFRDSPRQQPACNSAEIALIIEGNDPIPAAGTSSLGLPYYYLITSRVLWVSSLVQFLTNVGWAFLVTWLPSYLEKTYHVPPLTRGLMTSLPLFVGMAGMFWGGWLTDHLTRRVGRRWGRAAPLAVSRFIVAGGFAACLFLDAAWPVAIAMAVVALATDLGTPAIWAFTMDVGGRHVGSVLGWSNMMGNFGAALSPLLLNRILTEAGPAAMFTTCAAALFLAGILSFFLDGTKPIVPAESHRAL